MRSALIIDDEEGVRRSLALLLEDEGFRVVLASQAQEGLERAREGRFALVLCDVRMPGRDGLSILPELRSAQSRAVLLMMSAYDDVDQAVTAVRAGADDYLAKPFRLEELLLALRKCEERARLRSENRRLRRQLARLDPPRLIAASEAMRGVCELIERAAEVPSTVLITGESGTGKEVVAQSIHAQSERRDRPFLAVNCGAIPEPLIESELFGHVRGAFTGADRARTGLFREADGGTLFLDEIGELPLGVQVKLLRVLQEQEVRAVGEARAEPVDVRIIAATARRLEVEVAEERFRADLFYRINVLRIHVPPLRERRDDVGPLSEQLLRELAQRLGKRALALEPETLALLGRYAWPGNVRELENTLERALILSRGSRLTPDLLPFVAERKPAPDLPEPGPAEDAAEGGEDLSIKRRSRALESRLIRLALEQTHGNRTRAARILEISPRGLLYKIREYGLGEVGR
ncbi:MAG: sigma-54-dependent transcriptional regulator [Myxococcota bacterium]